MTIKLPNTLDQDLLNRPGQEYFWPWLKKHRPELCEEGIAPSGVEFNFEKAAHSHLSIAEHRRRADGSHKRGFKGMQKLL